MDELKTLVTAEHLAELGSSRAELVRGEVIDRVPVGQRHGETVIALGSSLRAFVRERRLGKVLTEVGVVLARDPDVVRAPDLAFIAAARLSSGNADGYFEGAPDLAVEVVSPDDRASDVQAKAGECLAAGVAANLNRPAIRSLLALAAYRLTEHRRRNDAAGAG